jgi:hypothetical protein
LISGIVIVIFVFIAVLLFSLINSRSQNPISKNSAVPTIVPLNNPSQSATQTKYNETSEWKIAEMLMQPPVLEPNDEAVRNTLLAPLNGFAGNIYNSSNVTIFYLPSIKEFGAKITTTNIDSAKKEAVDWFRSKGISQQGLCHLPLEFYMSYDAQKYLELHNVVFDPLPPGC